MDKFTEMIAHFVGIFHIAVEKARARESHEEFQASGPVPPEEPDLSYNRPAPSAPHEFEGFHPAVRYLPQVPGTEKASLIGKVSYAPLDVHTYGQPYLIPHPTLPPATGFPSPARFEPPAEFGPFEIDPPGQIAVYAKQSSHLYDNDILSIGDHGLYMVPNAASVLQLASMVARAEDFTSFRTDTIPGSGEEIAAFITGAAGRFESFLHRQHTTEGSDGPSIQQEHVFISDALPANGIIVNGQTVFELPRLTDHLPQPGLRDEEDGQPQLSRSQSTTSGVKDTGEPLTLGEAQSAGPGNTVAGAGNITVTSKLELEAGGNMSVNEAFIYNGGLTSMALAVMGDIHQSTVITQINAWWDQDLVSDGLSGWHKLDGGTTASYNIAQLQQIDPLAGQAASAPGSFPSHWSVTTITGDLIFLNWIEQFNFLSDNDSATLASTGVKTTITTGANTQINATSILELGYHYDLIFVGGSLYSGRFIDQLNILLDNDIFGTVGGFSTAGTASASTSGNLLWNEASIATVGGTGGVAPMPEHYMQSAANFAAGKLELADGVFADEVFAGLSHLNVLYVSGNIYDLQHIKQTNIVADADTIALVKSAKADTDGDWSITTGGNALVNVAGIVDFDAFGKTYLAGSHYSDELLIQADLVSSDPDLGGRDPDVLVSELIAFIDDDTPLSRNDEAPPAAIPNDSSQADVMQTMLA